MIQEIETDLTASTIERAVKANRSYRSIMSALNKQTNDRARERLAAAFLYLECYDKATPYRPAVFERVFGIWSRLHSRRVKKELLSNGTRKK